MVRTERHVDVSVRLPRDPGWRRGRSSVDWTRRAPAVVFAVVEVFGFVLWLVLGRFQWFFYDEWDFLAARTAGNLGDLFRPHNEHWTTLPILTYRLLYWAFGLSYFPFRVVVLLLHLTAAALLFVLILRAGVRPWIATAAASLFVLLGAGWENIIQPFQISFTGAIVFGLAQVLLADHDGRVSRRDWLGLLAGLLGLMTSGVAVTMVFVVGVGVLLRRGWRAAMFHTAPPAASYVAWLVIIGHRAYSFGRLSVSGDRRFVTTGVGAAFGAIGQAGAINVANAVILVVGGAFAWRQRRHSKQLSQLAAPIALLGGSVVFLAITATGRLVVGTDFARASRYMYLVVAMMLPALAIAADAITTRWRWFLPIAMAMFLVGVPGNFRAFNDARRYWKGPYERSRREMLSLAEDPLARQVPRSLRPDRAFAEPVTIGWLLDAVAHHRIPSLKGISQGDLMASHFRLSFDQQPMRSPTTRCRTLSGPLVIELRRADVIGLYYVPILLTRTQGNKFVGPMLEFSPADGMPVVVLRDVGRVRISAAPSLSPYPARICIGTA
jgi:hypothetical protein